jgi:peroxiredoxin Q/BCP
MGVNGPTRTPNKAKAERRATAAAERAAQQARGARRRKLRNTLIGIVALGALTGGLYAIFQHSTSASADSYAVGNPGIGQAAPGFTLSSDRGGTLSLAGFKGRSVLLYFQEGLTCQPCWDQLTDLQRNTAELKAAGVDQIVSITSDPVNLIAQKTTDMGITIPVLSDPNLAVSQTYNANQYGMMGTSRDGHTFILVGANGVIRWRADYGGAPNYTMDVPVAHLLADLKAGERS